MSSVSYLVYQRKDSGLRVRKLATTVRDSAWPPVPERPVNAIRSVPVFWSISDATGLVTLQVVEPLANTG